MESIKKTITELIIGLELSEKINCINELRECIHELSPFKNERIARELGMDEEEILRLCQITGLQDIFKDDDFSKSWESSDSVANYEVLTDDLTDEEVEHYRTTNTNDPERIFHTFDKWECHKARE